MAEMKQLKKYSKTKKNQKVTLYDLKTEYIVISLPLIDKDEFVKAFTLAIAERRAMYESNVQ